MLVFSLVESGKKSMNNEDKVSTSQAENRQKSAADYQDNFNTHQFYAKLRK